ncbi:hypothetical protein [Bacillus sp. FJAT-47783]|uniref:hypothetical protein n=1 Tax=Bacillus sp. FJAT-47783 TaxID=2922712 RepID=UPI001FAC96ED|nr:hypothetical protein [Bacillus sp. FJAT-47783]
MFGKIITVFIGFSCGYMYIRSLALEKPFDMTQFLLELILDPIQFFFAMVFFFVSFLANAYMFKHVIEETYELIKRKRWNGLQLLLSYSVFFVFYVLFLQGGVETFLLFIFSVVYSLLSIDLKVAKEIELER